MKPKICLVSVFNSESENSFHAYFFSTIDSLFDSVISSVPDRLKRGNTRVLKKFAVSVVGTLSVFNLVYDSSFNICYIEVDKVDDVLCPYAKFAFDYASEHNIVRAKFLGADCDYHFVFHPYSGGFSYIGTFNAGLRLSYLDNITDPA